MPVQLRILLLVWLFGHSQRNRITVGVQLSSFSQQYTTAQNNGVVVDVGAAEMMQVVQIQVVCSNANTVDVGFRVGLGAVVQAYGNNGIVIAHPKCPAGGGANRGDGSGIFASGAPGDDLLITCDAPTGGAIVVTVSYFCQD